MTMTGIRGHCDQPIGGDTVGNQFTLGTAQRM